MKWIKYLGTSVQAVGVMAAQSFTPEIPKVWDEELVATMELPLAGPAPRPVMPPAAWYYSIPTVVIFRTYPLEMPGKSPGEYRAWLEQQDPQVAVEVSKLKTKKDWIEAGKLVFETSLDPQLAPSPLPANSYPPSRYVIREKGRIERTTGCRECHNDVDSTSRTRPSYRASGDPEARRRFALPWLEPDPNSAVPALLRSSSRGVAIRWGGEPQFPLQVPDLTGVKDRKYLDHTGLHLHRSTGDLMRYAAMATNYGMERYRRYGDFIPAGAESRRLPDASSLRRFTDEQLYALALYVYSLEQPANPNTANDLSEMGRKVFQAQGCTACHTPPLYTNNKLVPADGFVVPPEHRKIYDVMSLSIGLDPWLAMQSRRGTGYYKVPSLMGVWRRKALEHRGSVLTLDDWFNPDRLRDDYIPTGFRGPTERRAVKGHEFGLKLSSEEKAALIAFLRTL